MFPLSTEVLIIGAGPTGLALAAALAQAGVDHVLIDERPSGQTTSRAAVVHLHTLEALSGLGVTEALTARGLQLPRFTLRDRDAPLLEIGFDALPSRFRRLLMTPQPVTERVLAERLVELGGSIRRGVRATELTALPDGGAEVVVESGGPPRRIRARYVVGADGLHSVVRKAAGIGFRGSAYRESFVLADVRMDWPLGRDEVSLFFSPAGMVVVAPLPDGTFRVVATVDEAPEVPDAAFVQGLLNARGPASRPGRVEAVVWSSRFRVHHRLADAYRRGPFLLMGDAAHVHSPAGGQGMNTGLVDAAVLAAALTEVIRDGAPDSRLDAYRQVRRPAAKQVLRLTGRLTAVATLRSPLLRRLRNRLIRFAGARPAVRRRLAMNLSGLSRRAYSRLPAAPGQHAGRGG